MCGLLKAAVILAAPVLAAARPFTQQDASHALVVDDVLTQETLFRIDILESETACGYGNITLDGQALHQDESGLGSGSIINERGNNLVARWKFTCIERDNEHQEQLLNFNLIAVDDKVRDVEYAMRFRQVAPVAITSFIMTDGAQSMIRAPESGSDEVDSIDQSRSVDIAEELEILELMKLRLLDLERAITRKEQYLSEAFNFRRNPAGDISTLAECTSLKCVVQSLMKNVKGAAHKLYTYGNDASFGRRHGHRQQTFTSPLEQAFSDRPLRDSRLKDRVSHVFEDEQQDEPRESRVSGTTFGAEIFDANRQEHPLQAPSDDVGLSNPPPPTPGREKAFIAGSPPSGGMDKHSLVDTKLAIGLLAGAVVLGLAISALHTRCFASTRKRCRARHQRYREKRATRRAALKTAVQRLVQRLYERLRRWRQQRWGRSLGDEEKEAALPCQPPRPHHQPHIETLTTEEDKPEQRHAPPSSDSGDSGDESDGSDGSDLSTTMEQELAQFRAVAGVVGDLIAAEEGRRSRAAASAARSRLPALASTYRCDIYTRARAGAEPLSPISVSSCPPEYASSDETLPPYDEEPSDLHLVADGFTYAPGSASYMPGYGSGEPPSLDEHLRRLC